MILIHLFINLKYLDVFIPKNLKLNFFPLTPLELYSQFKTFIEYN